MRRFLTAVNRMVVVLATLLTMQPLVLHAQTFQGGLRGTIRDAPVSEPGGIFDRSRVHSGQRTANPARPAFAWTVEHRPRARQGIPSRAIPARAVPRRSDQSVQHAVVYEPREHQLRRGELRPSHHAGEPVAVHAVHVPVVVLGRSWTEVTDSQTEERSNGGRTERCAETK